VLVLVQELVLEPELRPRLKLIASSLAASTVVVFCSYLFLLVAAWKGYTSSQNF